MTIRLDGMEFHAFHGCSPEERAVGNRYCVDLEYSYDAAPAADGDNLGRAVDYGAVYSVVREQMNVPSNLLENVAARILNAVHRSFPVIIAAKVTVTKYNPPVGGIVASASATAEF